ncbi:hypothetical protein [Methylobacterium sp. A52T]
MVSRTHRAGIGSQVHEPRGAQRFRERPPATGPPPGPFRRIVDGYLLLPPLPPCGDGRSGWLALPAAEELLERVSAACPVGDPVTAPGAPVEPD